MLTHEPLFHPVAAPVWVLVARIQIDDRHSEPIPDMLQGCPLSLPGGGLGAVNGSQRPVQKLQRASEPQLFMSHEGWQTPGSIVFLPYCAPTQVYPSRPQSKPLRHCRMHNRRLPTC